MAFEKYFNTSFLQKNPTIIQVLTHYDNDKIDKKDEQFSRKEVSIFIKDNVKTGNIGVLRSLLTTLIFKFLDTNNDKAISHAEIDNYLQKEYKITLDEFQNNDVKTACKILDQAG